MLVTELLLFTCDFDLDSPSLVLRKEVLSCFKVNAIFRHSAAFNRIGKYGVS